MSELSSFWNSTIEPALKNPWVDAGLGIGAAVLTGGLLAPELGAAFGIGDAAAAGAGAVGAPLDLSAFTTAGAAGSGTAAADAGTATALGFSGDVAGGAGGLDSFLASPGTASAFAAPGGTDIPTLALDSGLTGGVTPVGGLPTSSLAAAGTPVSGGLDLSGGTDLGGWLGTTDFGTGVAGGGAPSSITPSSVNFLQNAGVDPTVATNALNAPQQNGFFGSLADAASPSNIGAGIGKAVTNPLTDIGIAGLGYNLYQGYQQNQALKALTTQEQQQSQTAATNAAQANAAVQPELTQGETLQTYLTTGQLPPNIQSQVSQQVQAAKAQIIQGYGSRGMSTDPNQNSALAQDLANVDTQAQTLAGNLESQLATAGTQMVQTANSLLQTGINATNISAQIPIAMQNLNIQLAAATSSAIASFSSALNSGNQVKLNVTQAAA